MVPPALLGTAGRRLLRPHMGVWDVMSVSDWKAGTASDDVRRIDDAAVRTGSPSTAALPATAWRYLAIVATTIVLTAAGFVGLVEALDWAGRRPPPAFSNSYCFDVKLASFRDNPPLAPTHVVLGSSVAWRNVAADSIREQYPSARPLNASFCGLMVNQSAFVGRYFLQRFPSVTDVLLLLDAFDMSACRSSKTQVFDPADVSPYLSGEDDLRFYFKYFDIVSLVGNAFGTADASSISYPVTRLGDGPLLRAELPDHELVYGPPPETQPACIEALAVFAAEIERNGRHLVVATMPLRSDWSDKYDKNDESRKKFAASLRSALAGTSAQFWDAASAVVLPRAHYFDALHLHWGAAPAFTRRLVQATRFGAPD